MEPAHQRFDAVDHAAAQVHLRLEVQLQLAAGDGRAQFAADGQLAHRVLVVRGVVVFEGRAAPLGDVHGDVRVAQQRLRLARVLRKTRDADTQAHFDADARHVDGRPQAVDQRLRHRRDRLVAVRPVDDHREFVTADTRDEAALAERLLKALRDLAQHAIADVVSQGVVDFLEPAKIQHQQRDRRLRAVRLERALQVRQQGRTVRQ